MALVAPPSISSVNGLLQTSLSLEVATHNIGNSNIQLTSRFINGTFPGPTLRLSPGDTLAIDFDNLLENQGLGYVHNVFSAADDSNLHFHGLHVSGELPSDDVTHVVGPGESYSYSTTLPDEHMPGTHWMHPHRHGSTSLQVGGGAVSAIIVEDPPNTLPPQVENATEVLFVAHYLHVPELEGVARRSRDDIFGISGAPGNTFVTVNGQWKPTISVVPGEWIRLRVIWSMWLEGMLNLNIPGCEMQLLAKDGIYIRDFPRRIQTAPIVPGGRADIMVRCLDPSTSYNINGLTGTLAKIETTGDAVVEGNDLESWTPTYPAYLTDLRSTAASPGCSCVTEMDDDAVNGYPFDANQRLHRSYLGAIVQREIEADDHPYHQHVYPFQIVDGFGGYDQVGDWHDTIVGEGIVRYSPTEFTGKMMVHCHRLNHEDMGMMAIEEVSGGGACTCTEPPVNFALIGASVGVALLLLLIGFFCWRRRRNRQRASAGEKQEESNTAKQNDVESEDNEQPSS